MDLLKNKLPYGTGNVTFHGRQYWIQYRDERGVRVRENANTDDLREARRILLRRVLRRMNAEAAMLRRLLADDDQAPKRERSKVTAQGIAPRDAQGRQRRERVLSGRQAADRSARTRRAEGGNR